MKRRRKDVHASASLFLDRLQHQSEQSDAPASSSARAEEPTPKEEELPKLYAAALQQASGPQQELPAQVALSRHYLVSLNAAARKTAVAEQVNGHNVDKKDLQNILPTAFGRQVVLRCTGAGHKS